MGKINIIGAGILGASAAYELALKGHEVTVVDNWIKGRATSAAAGIICPWISKRRNMAWYALAKGGAAYYPNLIHHLQEDGEKETGYKKVGALRLHHDLDKLKELEEIALKRKTASPEMGEITLLEEAEAHTAFPYAEKGFHALYISGAARVDGNALRNALLSAAKKRCATIIDGKASLVLSENNITGIEVDGEMYPADTTIAANGVWMNELLAPLQPRVHFQAQKGELLHLQMTDSTWKENYPVVMPPNNQYILPLENGRIIAGATHFTAHEFEPRLSVEGTHYILEELLKMAPGLKPAEINDYRVGFRPFAKNHHPVFGPLPGWKQLLIANGLGASGLTTGPYIGKQLAKIAGGEIPDVPPADYSIELVE